MNGVDLSFNYHFYSGGCRLVEEGISDFYPSRSCPMLTRPKELVDLLDQLASRARVHIEHNRAVTTFRALDGGCKASWTGPNDR